MLRHMGVRRNCRRWGGGGEQAQKRLPIKTKRPPHRGKYPHMVKMTTHKEKNVAKRPQCGEKVAKAPPISRKKILGFFRVGAHAQVLDLCFTEGKCLGFALKPLSASKEHAYIICHELCYDVASLSSVVAKSPVDKEPKHILQSYNIAVIHCGISLTL